MVSYNYEWWTVRARTRTGVYTLEVKARNRENAIKQFKTGFNDVLEIYWDTLELDRVGHNR